MKKSELVRATASRLDITIKDTETVLNGLLDTIVDALKNEEEVRVSGFGMIKTKTMASTQRRNPRTGEMVEVPAHKIVKFKPFENLKNEVCE